MRKKRSVKRWIAARSEPERAALIGATAVLTAACLGVTGTIVTSALQARRSTAAVGSIEGGTTGMGLGEYPRPAAPARGREVVVDNHDSIDLDSPKSDLARTGNDAAPGIDLTVVLGDAGIYLKHDAHAFRATDEADLASCDASTALLPEIVSDDVNPGRSFCINTASGAWFWLKIDKIENMGNPGTISLRVDRLTHR